MATDQASTAANRFGLGARPGEIADIHDPRGWLLAQLQPAAFPAASQLPGSSEYLREEYAYRQARHARKQGGEQDAAAVQPMAGDSRRQAGLSGEALTQRRGLRRWQLAEVQARYALAATTQQPFAERLVRFWSNHFAVSVDKGQARLYAAPMEREAIRPNAFGGFAELLLAVETHPAMLRYLDNDSSIGPDSRFAQRRAQRGNGKQRGLNENLAREILELHTLGADSGYSQADVVEFARAITGWGVPFPREARNGVDSAFVFHESAHEPGARTVLGRRYPQDGQAQGRAILADLAMQPATARHLSSKLARHFVSDVPPPALVERMAQAYLRSGGELLALYRTLVESPEAWAPQARKLKSPDDYVVSALRAGNLALASQPQRLMQLLERLGQPVFTPRSPAGFPDTAADWGGSDGLWKRVQAAEELAQQVDSTTATPLALARAALGDSRIGGDFATALQRAGSPQSGYALLFASPAFQWRT